jgi:hypothetical protein
LVRKAKRSNASQAETKAENHADATDDAVQRRHFYFRAVTTAILAADQGNRSHQKYSGDDYPKKKEANKIRSIIGY